MRHEDVVCVMVYVSNYVCSPVPHPATKKFNHLIKKKQSLLNSLTLMLL